MITIALTHDQWNKIKDTIYTDLPLSVRLISEKHKKTLGFTVREFSGCVNVFPKDLEKKILVNIDFLTPEKYIEYIALDFVDEPTATLFRLRYL